jgi:hypothetical protein
MGVLFAFFFLGRRMPDTPQAPPQTVQSPPATVSSTSPPPAPSLPSRLEPVASQPMAPVHLGPPGFLVVEATPWGKLTIDGKSYGDVEGTKRFSLPPGVHEVRLVNRKVKPWTVTIESGKTHTVKGNFISE